MYMYQLNYLSVNFYFIKAYRNGGESGIRTHDRVTPIHALQACALNRSAISPDNNYYFIKFQSNYIYNH